LKQLSAQQSAKQMLGALTHRRLGTGAIPSQRTQTKYKDLTMHIQQSGQSGQKQTIESLAQEFKVSIDEVAQLYGDELGRLEIGARIRSFLHIFASRNVREMLLQRRTH
jgi:Protein of unknown function (DUF3562)